MVLLLLLFGLLLLLQFFFILSWAQFHQCSTYSFYACRSQKSKKILMTCLYFFTLLGSTSVKAEHKTLVKLTPRFVADSSRWCLVDICGLSGCCCCVTGCCFCCITRCGHWCVCCWCCFTSGQSSWRSVKSSMLADNFP